MQPFSIDSFPSLLSLVKSYFRNQEYLIQKIESIYPFAPVFKIELQNSEKKKKTLILKRTRTPLSQALSLQQWLIELRKTGVNTVLADELNLANPFSVENDVWVFYPYIEGLPYQPQSQFIQGAAALLGKMHLLELTEQSLPEYEFPKETSIQSFEEDLRGIHKNLQGIGENPNLHCGALSKMCENFPTLSKLLKGNYANLPLCVGTWDYKAINLVYKTPFEPVLVDPDSAGVMPRLFDFCLGVLLFHNESHDRALSEEEYRCFLKSYNTHIQFNETERELFPQVMEFMYLDEVIWLLANDSAGWKKESSQCRYLLDMISLGTNLNRYSLD